MNLQFAPGFAPALQTLALTLGMVLGLSAIAAAPAAAPGPPSSVPAVPALSAVSAAPASMAASAPAKATSQVSPAAAAKTTTADALPASTGNLMADKIRAALAGTVVASKKMTVVAENKDNKPGAAGPARGAAASQPVSATAKALASQRYNQARAAAIAGHGSGEPSTKPLIAPGVDAHWAYEGEHGPQAWGKLKPEFTLCTAGKRQSPIAIEDGNTLQGPAEPVQFAYTPSNGTVVNNGQTILVDVQGDNAITVRGSTYRLLQFHFHTPSEEQINAKRFPMVAHLMHKNTEGQLAVVAVLLDEGAANPLVDKVWTYMPLDSGDRVRMPLGLLNLSELLPTDQRYYQYMGSLTTPPCSEGVLWIVLKQPVSISRGQYKLFTQLYPNNARPVQAVNGRAVREAQ